MKFVKPVIADTELTGEEAAAISSVKTRKDAQDDVTRLYQSGVNVLDIVKRTKLSTATIYQILRRNRIPLRTGKVYPSETVRNPSFTFNPTKNQTTLVEMMREGDTLHITVRREAKDQVKKVVVSYE